MSNGNNNGHHRNGTGNGLVHAEQPAPYWIRGQRAKARRRTRCDAPDLLWDGLSPAVTNALGQPLDPALVSQRKGARRQGSSTTSKATSLSTRRTASSDTAAGAWNWSAT